MSPVTYTRIFFLKRAISSHVLQEGEGEEEKKDLPSQHQYLSSLFILPAISPYSLHMVEESHLFKLVSTLFERDGGQQKKEEREGREKEKDREDTSR